jgi:hypothetical protein
MRAIVVAALSMIGVLGAGVVRADPLAQVGTDLPKLPPATLQAPAAPAELLSEKHGWISVVYHPSLYDVAQRLVHEGDATRAALQSMLGVAVLDSIEVRVARTKEELDALSPREAPPPAGAWGVPYAPIRLIVVAQPLSTAGGRGAPNDDAPSAEDVFRHELAHVALFDATAGRPLPRWLDEGFAVHATGERSLSRLHTLWRAEVSGPWLSVGQLESFPDEPTLARVADAESADLVRFLSSDDDHARFVAFLARVRAGDVIDHAAAESYGANLATLEHRWHEDVTRRCVTTPLAVAGGLGWGLAGAAIVVAWRRRRRAAARKLALEAQAALAQKAGGSAEKLVVVEEGVGHVVYMVERPPVPTVEHDGKMHTLH